MLTGDKQRVSFERLKTKSDFDCVVRLLEDIGWKQVGTSHRKRIRRK